MFAPKVAKAPAEPKAGSASALAPRRWGEGRSEAGGCNDRSGVTRDFSRSPLFPPAVRAVVRSSGQPLDFATRADMEETFGQDLAHVRMHTGDAAARSAREIGAAAYAFGSHIAVDHEHHPPSTARGRRVLSHELAHVIQQSRDGVAAAADPSLERHAEEAAGAAARRRGPVAVLGAAQPGIARLPGGPPGGEGGGPKQVAQTLVKGLQAESKPVIVNIGGAGAAHEPPDAINVNPNVVAPRKDIPNLVQAKGEEIGDLFEPGQVSKVVGHRLSPPVFNWEQIAEGAHKVLQDGGTFNVNFRWADREAAEKLASALRKAGFRDVRNIGNVVVTATKGAGPSIPGGGTPTPALRPGGTPKTATTPEIVPPSAKTPVEVLPEGAIPSPRAVEIPLGETIVGAALKGVLELAIGIAIGLAVQWVLSKLIELQIEIDIKNILRPQIAKKLEQLKPKLVALQGRRKVFVRVTYEFRYSRTPDPIWAMANPPFYEWGSVRLVNLHPGNEELDFEATKGEDVEKIMPERERVRAWFSYSVLLDDPATRPPAAPPIPEVNVEDLPKAGPVIPEVNVEDLPKAR